MYALMGLIFGAFFSIFSVLGATAGPNGPPLPFTFLGIGGIVIMPIFYGLMGFIGGAIAAAVYNFVAGYVGGFEMEFQRQVMPETSGTDTY